MMNSTYLSISFIKFIICNNKLCFHLFAGDKNRIGSDF